MRNTVLACVVVVALLGAGIGGAFAHFVDTEIAEDNVFEMGSLDLLVNGNNDLRMENDAVLWGEGGIDPLFDVTCAKPGVPYWAEVTVENAGSCVSGNLEILFKNLYCYNAEPCCCDAVTYEYGGILNEYILPNGPHETLGKEEPELVAEYGGKVDCTWVDGIGRTGDNCSMMSGTWIQIWFGPAAGDLEIVFGSADWFDATDGKRVKDLMDPPYNGLLTLGELPSCGADYTVKIGLLLPDYLDELTDWGWYDPDGNWVAHPKADILSGWPTNGFALDGIKFDVEFILDQEAGISIPWPD